MIIGLHHVQITIPVGAEDEARKFYCGVLGLNEIPKPVELIGRGGFWVQLGDKQIHVGTENGVDRTATKSHIAYLVDDLNTWREKLQDYGIDIKAGIQIPNFQRFEFRDPFGNRIEFLQKI